MCIRDRFFYGWLVNFKGASLPPHVFISGTALTQFTCDLVSVVHVCHGLCITSQKLFSLQAHGLEIPKKLLPYRDKINRNAVKMFTYSLSGQHE